MATPRGRKRKAFKFTRLSTLMLGGLFVVSVALGTLGVNASRESQLAAAALKKPACDGIPHGDADKMCERADEVTITYSCSFPQSKKGGKGTDKNAKCEKLLPCHETVAGKKLIGTCQSNFCCKLNPVEATNKNDPEKGKEQPKGDGKMPEVPKFPEPKPDSKPPGGEPPPKEACKAGSAPGSVDASGQPCPGSVSTPINECLLEPTAQGCPGASAFAAAPDTAQTPPAPTPPSSSWSAIIRNLKDEASNFVTGAANVVTNTAQSIGASFGSNSAPAVDTEDVVTYTSAGGTENSAPMAGNSDATTKTFAQTTGFTQGNTSISPDLSGSTPSGGGFLNWAGAQLRNFFGIF
ncbi:MAG: hypothetical protein Q7R90_00230 [bacterium]|nr:hypothetical protein [bacterium]